MEPKGSTPNPQELSTFPYPEQDLSSPLHPSPPIQMSYPYSIAWVVYPEIPSRSEGSLMTFVTNLFFYGDGLLAPRPISELEDTPCRLSAPAYSIYSQLPSITAGRSSIRKRHAVVTGNPPNMEAGYMDTNNHNKLYIKILNLQSNILSCFTKTLIQNGHK
jgi:hypothetical protein